MRIAKALGEIPRATRALNGRTYAGRGRAIICSIRPTDLSVDHDELLPNGGVVQVKNPLGFEILHGDILALEGTPTDAGPALFVVAVGILDGSE